MEETGKKNLWIVLIVLAGIIYFFVFAVPLPKELVFSPTWSLKLSGPRPEGTAAAAVSSIPGDAARTQKPAADAAKAAVKAPAQEIAPFVRGEAAGAAGLIPFNFGKLFGYFSRDGKLGFSQGLPFGLALSRKAYIAYDQIPESLVLKTPDGTDKLKIDETGYPFYSGERLFVMKPGQSGVIELGSDGKPLWERDFPSIITAFDASANLVAIGLLDGNLIGIGNKGEELIKFAPGGSRIPGIYGCAVSPDGELVAAVSGLDQQRLVILERRTSAYRVTFHKWFNSDFRRPVHMGFTADGRYLVYEEPDGFGVYSRSARTEKHVSSWTVRHLGSSIPGRDILLAIEGQGGDHKAVLGASPEGRRMFTMSFNAADGYLAQEGGALFLGMAAADGSSQIVRIDLREE